MIVNKPYPYLKRLTPYRLDEELGEEFDEVEEMSDYEVYAMENRRDTL
jgi:hypothetical protein